MATAKQRTVRNKARVTGIALHTGNRVALSILPAAVDAGIVFRRIDLEGAPEVRARIEHVVDTRRGTTISENGAAVHTVEHLLAALHAFGIDNAILEMSGPEPPVGDGSSNPFVQMLEAAGSKPQGKVRRYITPTRILFHENDDTRLVVVPAPSFRIMCTVQFNTSHLGCQYLAVDIAKDTFIRELAAARTFCMHDEIEALIRANLICGGSLDNAVVIKGDAILSRDGLRYPDEFVRHKMLDIVGDFYLLGAPLRAQVIAIRPGHAANVAMAHLINTNAGEI